MHSARFQLHHEQQVIGHQAALGSDLNRCKIDRCHDLALSLQEGLPRSIALTLGCWFDATCFQNIGYRCVGDLKADLGELSLNSVVAPGWVPLANSRVRSTIS